MKSFALLIACVVCVFSLSIVVDGCFQPRRNIGDEAGLAADICSINEALGRSPPDYVTAKAYYRLGFAARDFTLTNITTGQIIEGEFVERSAALFGSEAWMDDILQSALDGDGVLDSDKKRVQMIKKVLQSAALGHRMFTNTEISFENAAGGHWRRARLFLVKAMSNYFGFNSHCAIFGNGQSRGIDFGTMNEGVSKANYEIVNAFSDAEEAIQEDSIDLESLGYAYDEILKYFLTIYLQAVTKYAIEIVNNQEVEEAQAEGFGYYHAIAGQVHAISEEAHQMIYDAFDISSDPDADKASLVPDVVENLIEELEISKLAFGLYNEESSGEYEQPEVPACEAINPFAENVIDFSDNDR